MANPLYKQLGGGMNHQQAQNDSLSVFLQQYSQFKNTIQGDPRQMVQQLLSSGQMSNEEFNKLAQIANQLRHFVP
jgi:hypothetical protein